MEKENALKILRELHDKALFSERTALETFIPELKESEDEKVRKTLVELVKCNERSGHFLINNVTTSSMLAWLENIPYTIDHEKREGFHLGYKAVLEKQNEQRPNDRLAWSEEDEFYLNTTIAYLKDAQEFKKTAENCIDWLKNLKQKMKGE